METFLVLLKILFVLSAFLTILGLFWPWYALWWSPRQNRLMVLKYYGITALVAYLFWKLSEF